MILKDLDHELIWEAFITEKDHRQKMLKFGIPEEVANWLHEYDDKRSLWFANQIKNMTGFQNARDKINWIRTNLEYNMRGIIDWVQNVPNIMLNKYDWESAIAAQQEYHDNLQTQSLSKNEHNTIIKTYNDGFYWVDLETNSCREEANAMGHCASTSADTLFSLRKYTPETQTIEPFVTIAASPDKGIWQQAKGKHNSKPKEQYWKYIADILVQYNMLQFKSEYNPKDDFTSDTLRYYVENHPDEFENPDELLEQIESFSIPIERFQQAIDEIGFKYYDYNIDEDDYGNDESQKVYVRKSFYIEIPMETFGKYRYDVENYVGNNDLEDSRETSDIIEYVFQIYTPNYARIESDNEHIIFHYDVDGDDNVFAQTEDGLEAFKSDLVYYKNQDDDVDPTEIADRFVHLLKVQQIIEDPFIEYAHMIKDAIADSILDHAKISEDPHHRRNKNTINFNVEWISMLPTEVKDQHYKIKILPYINSIVMAESDGYYVSSNEQDSNARNLEYLQQLKNPAYYVLKFWEDELTKYFKINSAHFFINTSWIYKIRINIKYKENFNSDDFNSESAFKELKIFNDKFISIHKRFNQMLVDIFVPSIENVKLIDNGKRYQFQHPDNNQPTTSGRRYGKIDINTTDSNPISVIDTETGKKYEFTYDYYLPADYNKRDFLKHKLDKPEIEYIYTDFNIDKLKPYLDPKQRDTHPDQQELDLNKTIIKFKTIFYG